MTAVPRLIVFEGMDGSGKSTLSKAVADQLLWRTPPQHMVFPSKDGEVGKLIRRTFAQEVILGDGKINGTQDRVLGYLMVADGVDRDHHVRLALADQRSVVCDRHPMVSGWVYQRSCMSIDEVLAIQQRSQFARPDIVFLLDVPAPVAIERMQQRGGIKNPIFERDGEYYVDQLRNRYASYSMMHDNVVVLDGQKTVDALLMEVADHLRLWEVIR